MVAKERTELDSFGHCWTGRKKAAARRRFYGDSRHIANGLLNEHFYDPRVSDDCLLRYRNRHFFLFMPVPVSRISLRRFIVGHIEKLNSHPLARNEPEQQISTSPKKVRSVLLALQRLLEKQA